jgi:hypothetical protein
MQTTVYDIFFGDMLIGDGFESFAAAQEMVDNSPFLSSQTRAYWFMFDMGFTPEGPEVIIRARDIEPEPAPEITAPASTVQTHTPTARQLAARYLDARSKENSPDQTSARAWHDEANRLYQEAMKRRGKETSEFRRIVRHSR